MTDPNDAGTNSNAIDTTTGSNHDFWKYPVLEIDGQTPESNQTTFQFVFAGNVTIDENPQAEAVLQGIINSPTLGILVEGLADLNSDTGGRRQIFIDVGAGSDDWTIDFRAWTGADSSADFFWGDVEDGAGSTNATADSAKEQMLLLNRVLTSTVYSSVNINIQGLSSGGNPARLYYGDYAPSNAGPNNSQGQFNEDYLPCVITANNTTRSYEDNDSFDGSIEVTAVKSIDINIDVLTENVSI